MTDQLISFETAILAKEKGFKEECAYYYNNKTGILKPFMFDDNPKVVSLQDGTNAGLLTITPTQSLLQKWLRELHNMNIVIMTSINQSGKFQMSIEEIIKSFGTDMSDSIYCKDIDYDTYEEALEQGLLQALKLIIL